MSPSVAGSFDVIERKQPIEISQIKACCRVYPNIF